MFGLEEKKQNEISSIVTILMNIGESKRTLLLRDANTLLSLQKFEEEQQSNEGKIG